MPCSMKEGNAMKPQGAVRTGNDRMSAHYTRVFPETERGESFRTGKNPDTPVEIKGSAHPVKQSERKTESEERGEIT